MKERVARGVAAGFALLLAVVYCFFPYKETSTYFNNSGQQMLKLVPEQVYEWSWSPEQDGTESVDLRLAGMKKAAGVTVFAKVLEESGAEAAAVSQPVAELGANVDYVRLNGSFSAGRSYTLRVWMEVEGEGSIWLKGEEAEDTEAFFPLLSERAEVDRRNVVLLYFAAGALMAALTPVFGKRRAPVKSGRMEQGWIGRALPWATFALLAGLGIAITLIRPMFSVGEGWGSWDEDTHWRLVQSMSLFSEEGIPYLGLSMITWTPGYIPLSVGYNLARIFTTDAATLYRAAVGCNALCYAALCALAVKHAPRYKATFLVAGTMPTLIFLMTSASYDAVVTGCVLLGVALALEAMDQEGQISPLRAITMVSVLAFGTVAKPAYSLALLSLLMIPKEKFAGKRQAWFFRVFVILMLVWCMLAMLMPGAYDTVREGDSRFEGTSVSGQLEYMLAHPVEGGLKPILYVLTSWDFLTRAGISHWAYLGNNEILNTIYLVLLLVAAPLCTAGESMAKKSPLTPGRRIKLGLIALGAEIVLSYGQYLASSEVGGGVRGMQARYFIPVWAVMALAVMWPHRIRERLGKAGEWLTVVVFLACLGGNLQNLLMHLEKLGMI